MADPYCFRCPFGKEPASCHHECAEDLETALLREGPETVAAVILEGVVGANGVFVPPAGYWKKIRAICDRHGVLLIADEVLSGFGRTGRWFAVDHDGVTPDLLTVAKGVTGGYAPGGAVDRHRAHRAPLRRRGALVRPDQLRATRWSARRSSPRSRPCATSGWSSAPPRSATGWGRGWRRSPPRARTSATCAASGCSGRSSCASPGRATSRPLRLPWRGWRRALRAHHLHMHKRDNLLYFAPPLVIARDEIDEALVALGRRARRGARVKSKVYPDVDAALDGLADGMSIMSGGFGLSGNAEACIEAIARRGVKGLTIISNNCGNQGQGLAVLLKNRQVRKVICSFIGGNPDLAEQYLAGEVEVELNPQGTFAERIRAGGAGIGGFFTPTGVGTIVAEGKEIAR